MNLVVCNMSNYSDWEEGVVNRNFFVVNELRKNPRFEKILLIDFLAQQPIKRIFGRKRILYYALKGKGVKEIAPNQYILSGLNVHTSKQQVVKKIERVMHELEMAPSNTMLLSYNPFFPEVFSLPVKQKVFEAVDNWAHHASYKREADELHKSYNQINTVADQIFTVSEGLVNLFSKDKTTWIPNGIDIEKFKRVKDVDLPGGAPYIGYVGTIQERLDFDLIEKIASDHKDKSFVFIGPVWKGVQDSVDALKLSHNNIHFLGRKAYSEIPSYLAKMNVTIIPHRIDAFINSTNPMKMYDYLAAGKPVVTTPGAGTDMFADHLMIVSTGEAFSHAINEVLTSDTKEKQAQRRDTVKNHTWKQRVETMLKILLN